MQYRPVFIDGRPYAVRLPTGGSSFGEDSEWDQMLDILGEKNPDFHAKNILSWCQDTDRNDPNCRVYRGQISPRHRNSTYSYRCEYSHIGYRPVLEPLDPQTLQPTPDTLRDLPDGTILTMGSFYLDGVPQPIPTDPDWCGNIPQYRAGRTIAIGDTASGTDRQLRFIKCGNLLWCDRNLLTCVSWDTLSDFNLVCGIVFDPPMMPQMLTSLQHNLSLDHRIVCAKNSNQSRTFSERIDHQSRCSLTM